MVHTSAAKLMGIKAYSVCCVHDVCNVKMVNTFYL